MALWKQTNLEIVDVPHRLIDYAKEIIYELAVYVKNHQPLHANDHFAGFLADNQQKLVNFASFRQSAKYLRVVDFEKELHAGFPYKLFASYLVEESIETTRDKTREEEIRMAVEIYNEIDTYGEIEMETAYQKGHNVNNYAGFERLGDLLLDEGDKKGWDYLYQAIVRCPIYAREFAAEIKHRFKGNYPQDDGRLRFWGKLDDIKIKEIILKSGTNVTTK